MVGLPDGSIYERREDLYIDDQYGVFFATGQPTQENDRCAFVAIKSMHTLTEKQCDLLRLHAKPSSESHVSIHVNPKTQTITFYDQYTKTQTVFPLSDLSVEVQKKFPLEKVRNYFDKLHL